MNADTQKRSPLRLILILCISLIIVAIFSIGATLAFDGGTMFAGKRPDNLGVQSGKLTPCPGTPNCVNSQSADPEHAIAPLSYKTTPQEAMADLKAVVENMERTNIITESNNYLYAEFKSALMGFVDDVEFFLDESKNVIQVRSASRLGKSDLGVNRKRVEAIRENLGERQKSKA